MSFTFMKIRGKKMYLTSAGMPPVYFYSSNSETIEEISMKGMPLGAMKNFPYTLHEGQLEPGDTILLLTDGLPELANANDEMYGYDRIKSEFLSIGEKEPEEIINILKDSALVWVDNKDPDDDVTFVVIKAK